MAEIIPVLLGGDLNSYNIARAFYEVYGVKSRVFDTSAMPETEYSTFTEIHILPALDDAFALSDILAEFASAHSGATLVVFGCTDNYVRLLIDARERGLMPSSCFIPHPTARVRDMFADKADFYAMCGKYNIPTPETTDSAGDNMRVLTTYSDKSGRVRMASLGHVLLEEPTPHGIGNHSAIITAHATELTAPFRAMLDAEGYTGFCNFDIKYDEKSGRFLALDMNLRQGRSNYYVTAAGANIAELAVRDLVFDETLPYTETDKEIFWHSIPKSTVYKYTSDKNLVGLARRLDGEGQAVSSLYCKADVYSRPLRFLCVLEVMRRERTKYRKYCKNR